ncbi:MAG: UDP-N-acetylglucosamine--N-acetylmuramyl-(pentapeptide) pyrophosphoryl-undecaprenol N-acetylglucosamine transferase [Phycisphaerae bacterium]
MVIWPHRVSPLAAGGTPATRNAGVPPAVEHTGRVVRIVMAGGGTGGHLYPGLAVAEALEQECANTGGVELIWAATPRTVDQHLLSGFGNRYVKQPVQPLVKSLSKMWGFWRGWQKSCAYWKTYFREQKVDAVLALGGYAAGPAAYMAGKQGIPVGLLNPDAVPGLANRFLLKRAARIFSQWPLDETMTHGIPGQVLPLGCPIRGALTQRSRTEGAAKLGLDPARPTLVVCGGSLAAKTINDAMLALIADANVLAALRGENQEGLPPSQAAAAAAGGSGIWQILHLAGSAQAADVKKAYEPIKGGGVGWQVLDYCDDMASVWAVADLAIARAGASTCAELLACGVPSILLPYPFHRDQHQRHNAAQLVAADAAVLVDDQKGAAANARCIKTPLVQLLYDQRARFEMAAAARAAGKPNAARDIARVLLALVK